MFPRTADVFDPIAWWARVEGNRTAVIEAVSGAHHSYAALDADADAWSARLARWGVRHGDRVAILSHNRYEFLPLLFGCIRRGAILVPLNWRLTAPELARVLDDASPSLLLGEDRLRSLAEEAVRVSSLNDGLGWRDLDRDIAPEHDPAPASPERAAEDATMLLYTSGSTGTPKGVIIPHRQLIWNAIATATGWLLNASDVGPAATPFFHTGGWNVFTTPLLSRGGTIVLIDGFDPDAYFDMLDAHRVTITFGVPTQLAMVRETASWGRPLPHLRMFMSGGAPCPQRVKDDVRAAGYVLREGYGLTECGPNCFATNDHTAVAKDGSVGWPMPFLGMRLRDTDGSDVGADAIGELELRGPQMFGGYFRAADRTADVMTADGWLKTGDLASRDADGVFTIRGRRKEMYISGGENVFPGEVEAVLLDCAGVREVTVIGIAHERWGEVGCALIVRSDPALDAHAVERFARSRLAAYKVPKRVCFVDAIPRLGSGKIDRRAAAALIAP
ncbi:MAG: AMP-binding protein [Gemmatimonadaceae bacterium]|jgi:fatty-acyl-CoA synthase|nr:AMP-binding protein [Gemmatimonadaceae bacterium]MCC6429283.1 AMP-binding protein [Gemmatimonadaceae bacterium]